MKKPTLDFIRNDYLQNIVVYAIKDGIGCYLFSDKEFWIVAYWYGYVDVPIGTTLEESYSAFVSQFLVTITDLKNEARKRFQENKVEVVLLNKPQLYVDFDQKILLSQYYDQALENRMIAGWKGSFVSFEKLIPPADRYWEAE
jgi:hypothetical protein